MGNNTEQFDVGAMAPTSDTFEFEVFNPITKAGTDIWITIASRDSDEHKKITRTQMNRRFKQMGRRMSVQLTAEENEAEALEILVACTKSWRTGKEPSIKLGGQILASGDAEAARTLYTKVPTIREQTEDNISDRSNFLPR